MQKKIKFILDMGSSNLRLLAVSKVCGEARIVAEENFLFDGFMDGEFLSPDELQDNLAELLTNMSNKMHTKINLITVGVPSEFCVCVCKRIKRSFVDLHKITVMDITDLYENNMDFGDSCEYEVINYSPMQFVLDGDFKTLAPVGVKTTSLVLDASYVLAKKSFIKFVTETLNKCGVVNVEFISSALGQAMLCSTNLNNQKPIAVIDCGHITTSVAIFKGEGLALLSSFSMGGGHISADLMQVLDLGFKEAELIKRKAILTVESPKNDNYIVNYNGSLIKAPINLTNQIIKSRIEMIANIIANILTVNEVFKDVDIYLTGDGLSNFKGAKNIIKEVTKLDVFDFKIPFENSQGKYQTSKLGLTSLMEVAI